MTESNENQRGRRASLKTGLRRLAELPGGTADKFAVVAVWLVARFALGPLAGKSEDAQQNDAAHYLPRNAESVKTIDRLHGFRSDGEADAITVFHRDGGLTAADRAAIERVRDGINERVRPAMNAVRSESVGETAAARLSADAGTALLTTPIMVPAAASGNAEDIITDTPEEIEDRLVTAQRPRGQGHRPGRVLVRRRRGLQGINGTLLFATAGLVLLLLIVIYRSPISG